MIPNPTSTGKTGEAVILATLVKLGKSVVIPWGEERCDLALVSATLGDPLTAPERRARPQSGLRRRCAAYELVDGCLDSVLDVRRAERAAAGLWA